MTEKRRYDPGSVFEDEGIPDLQDGTPGQQRAVDPQEMPLPTERPAAVEGYGTTAAEQQHGESLEDRLRQEEPDFGQESFRHRRGTHAPSDPGGGSEPAWPAADPSAAGRLVAPDLGGGLHIESQAIAEDFGADGGGFSAEEQAIHVRGEPPLEDDVPDYTEPDGRSTNR
jgi:hypothetical protein